MARTPNYRFERNERARKKAEKKAAKAEKKAAARSGADTDGDASAAGEGVEPEADRPEASDGTTDTSKPLG